MAELPPREGAAERKALEEEYKLLLARWDDYDRRVLGIKGWVIAGSVVAAIGVQPTTRWYSFVAAFLIVGSAWFTEAIWKSWQHANGERLKTLERYFRGEQDAPVPYQIFWSWNQHYGEPFSFRKAVAEMGKPFVLLPYALLMVLAFLGATFWH